jgi:hypothetical protein
MERNDEEDEDRNPSLRRTHGDLGSEYQVYAYQSYAVVQAPNDELAGNRLGNPADCDDAVNIAAILVPILPKQPELTRGIEPLTC